MRSRNPYKGADEREPGQATYFHKRNDADTSVEKGLLSFFKDLL